MVNIIEQRFRDSFWGGYAGDVLGSVHEFKDPLNIVPSGSIKNLLGRFPLNVFGNPTGTPTDDTILMLCAMESFIEAGKFDVDSQMMHMGNYIERGRWSPTGKCFDVGGATASSYFAWKADREMPENSKMNSGGNGVLMKLTPYAFWSFHNVPKQEKESYYRQVNNLTHGEIAFESTYKMGLLLEDIWNNSVDSIEKYELTSKFTLTPTGFSHGSYNLALLYYETMIDSKLKPRNLEFEDLVLDIIETHGGDTDTNACILGQMIGYDGIPAFVKYTDKINPILDEFIDVCQYRIPTSKSN